MTVCSQRENDSLNVVVVRYREWLTNVIVYIAEEMATLPNLACSLLNWQHEFLQRQVDNVVSIAATLSGAVRVVLFTYLAHGHTCHQEAFQMAWLPELVRAGQAMTATIGENERDACYVEETLTIIVVDYEFEPLYVEMQVEAMGRADIVINLAEKLVTIP